MPCRRSRTARDTTARRVVRRLALATSLGASVASLVKRRRAKDAAEVRAERAPSWPPLER